MLQANELQTRFIPFSALRYSTEAFIDYRIPGCGPKYNYALVGPGVSQNPKQPVNLREPHGFQVGGVSMPHGTTNPPHMHFTCEVFVCVRGDWEIHWGFNPEKQTATLHRGDIISVPTWLYRGFRNIGVDDGFLFTALGGNDTGGILWGPQTLAAAAEQGVYLTEDYRIVDTVAGDTMQSGERPLQPMSESEIAQLKVWSPEDMRQRIVRTGELRWSAQGAVDSLLPGGGAQFAPVIGLGMSQDRQASPPIANAHGVSLEWLQLPPGGALHRHRLHEAQVIIVYEGSLSVSIEGCDAAVCQTLHGTATAWDTVSIPPSHWRTVTALGDTPVRALVMTQGDHRKAIEWCPTVVDHAATHGWSIDANGCVAPKQFVDRAQR